MGSYPLPFLKNKKVSRFCPFISYLKCNFMIILQKKLQSFPLHDLCFAWCRWNVCRSARISRNLPYAAKVLFAPLERVGANLKNGKTLKIYHCKKGALPFAFYRNQAASKSHCTKYYEEKNSSKTLSKICVSTKFPHHKIRKNYGILNSKGPFACLLNIQNWLLSDMTV